MTFLTPYVSTRVTNAVYAVRGRIPTRAMEIQQELLSSTDAVQYPFQRLIFCNIGNPQALGLTPLTFPRQVLSIFDYPSLLRCPSASSMFPLDVLRRAQDILSKTKGMTGAYTESAGYAFVREDVARFITHRDHSHNPSLRAACASDIFLTDGASPAVKCILQLLIDSEQDAAMIPIPQYPLYTATIALLGGSVAPYYLNEDKGWAITSQDLETAWDLAISKGTTPRLIVIINPGNPTGQIFTQEAIQTVLDFAAKKGILILADEVYQENIYRPDHVFHSFREVLLSSVHCTSVGLISIHSTSKGILGECGRRGGYFECINIPASVRCEVQKLMSINLCANVSGQILLDLMVTPPNEQDDSYATYTQEYTRAFNSLQQRANIVCESLNTIRGIHCNAIEGAMYAFPRILLPSSYVAYNDECNDKERTEFQQTSGLNGQKTFVAMAPDERWAYDLLEQTGIVVVPGSGFGQKEGEFHFRITILPQLEDLKYTLQQIQTYHEKLLSRF